MNENEIKEIVGKNMRAFRKSRNMSIHDVATLLGISPGFLALMERAKRGVSITYLHKLSSIFNCTIESFFTAPSDFKESDTENIKIEKYKIKLLKSITDMTENELKLVINLCKDVKMLRNDSKFKLDSI